MVWDVSVPAGSDPIRSGDNVIRELKVDITAALTAHGTFPGADTANPVYRPIPAGCIMDYAGAAAPTGWLICNGASLLRAGTYADLFTAIGTAFGSVDGTHFTIPDCRGKASIGVGTGAGLTARALADTGGEETHIITLAESPIHDHAITVTDPGHTHNIKSNGAVGTTFPVLTVDGTGSTHPSNSASTGITASADSKGSGNAHNNMQPFIALNKIIKI